jgi:HAD superfamily hydrolase (TIGR01549 family)
MEIKAVLLDFGGTLVSGGLEWDPYHESIRNYLLSHGYNIEMRDLKKALRGALANLEKTRSKGLEMTFEEVYSIFLNKLGISHDDLMLEWLHENFRNYYKTSFYPCVEDILRDLSSKYKVAMISNTMSDQPKLLLREANMDQYFDLLICSRDLGVRKPNPEVFKIVLEQIKVKPSETVHVGDSVEADMYGARDSGITGIWIKTQDQPPWNGYAISSICELSRFLETLRDGENSLDI